MTTTIPNPFTQPINTETRDDVNENKKVTMSDLLAGGGKEDARGDNDTGDSRTDIDRAMDTDVLLKEDMIMRYLDLVMPEDRHLLNLPYIHEKGEEYIQNWRTTVLPPYKEQLRNLVSKYSNRRKYQIRALKTKVIAIAYTPSMEGDSSTGSSDSKSDRRGIRTIVNADESKPLASIDKPVFMDLDRVLLQGRNMLQSRRSAIRMQYEHLMSKSYLDEKDKVRFMKQREAYIETLNSYYAVQYYSNKINDHVTYNKDISVPIVQYYQQQDVKNPVPRVDSVDINIDAELIGKMYEQEGAKLDMYNHILELQATDAPRKELDAAVREYLQYDETNDVMKGINKQIKKLKNRHPVAWLVVATAADRPEFCKRHVPLSRSTTTKSSSSNNNNSYSNQN